jgi:hypothetical protein
MERDMHSPNAWIERIELLVVIVLQLAIAVVVAGAIVDRVLSTHDAALQKRKSVRLSTTCEQHARTPVRDRISYFALNDT